MFQPEKTFKLCGVLFLFPALAAMAPAQTFPPYDPCAPPPPCGSGTSILNCASQVSPSNGFYISNASGWAVKSLQGSTYAVTPTSSASSPVSDKSPYSLALANQYQITTTNTTLEFTVELAFSTAGMPAGMEVLLAEMRNDLTAVLNRTG